MMFINHIAAPLTPPGPRKGPRAWQALKLKPQVNLPQTGGHSEEREGSVHHGCWAENGQQGPKEAAGPPRGCPGERWWCVDQDDGHADGRGRQIPGNLVCADLEEGKRGLREEPRALECQPHCSPDSACLILVFPPCILGSRTWLALPLLLCCVGPLHITRTRAHLQSRVRSSGEGTGPVMSSRFKGRGRSSLGAQHW